MRDLGTRRPQIAANQALTVEVINRKQIDIKAPRERSGKYQASGKQCRQEADRSRA